MEATLHQFEPCKRPNVKIHYLPKKWSMKGVWVGQVANLFRSPFFLFLFRFPSVVFFPFACINNVVTRVIHRDHIALAMQC